MILFALLLATAAVPSGEQPVDPYVADNATPGAAPFADDRILAAIHGRPGIDRITDDFVDRLVVDRRIAEIFKGQDIVRLRRTLKEQFCYILNGGCAYSGRDMKAAHKDMGLQSADFGALVENLQGAMSRERVAFAAQNRFLAKLAPMKPDTVRRR